MDPDRRALPAGSAEVPDLVLAPENILHKIGKVFGYQDIDFDSSPDFSSHYLLRGPDEMAIRSAFGADARRTSGRSGMARGGRGGSVGIYRSDKRCKPEDLAAFRDQASACSGPSRAADGRGRLPRLRAVLRLFVRRGFFDESPRGCSGSSRSRPRPPTRGLVDALTPSPEYSDRYEGSSYPR